MMHHKATNAARPPSLVDTLGTGFRALNRGLPALVVPLAIDLWLWLGPRISVRPLAEWLRSLDPSTWDQARAQIAAAVPEGRPFDLRLNGQIRFWFWRPIYQFEVPPGSPQLVEPAIWSIDNLLVLCGTLIAINMIAALLTAIYLLSLADVVRGSAHPGHWLRQVVRTWLALMGVLGIILTFLMVVGIPLFAIASVLATVVPMVGYFVLAFLFAVVIWVVFSASFAYDAVALNRAGPIGALLASLVVVRRYFWSAIGLFLLKIFILAGLGIIWHGLARSIPGLLIAMATSAYVGAGLAAAHLVFFRDRFPAPVAVQAQ